MSLSGSTRITDWSTEIRPSAASGDRIATEARARWARGETPDVRRLLEERPELRRNRSIALELAYEEYCHRLKSGERVDPDGFSRRFPALQRSLYMLIVVQNLLSADPSLQAPEQPAVWPDAGESFLGFSLIAEIGRGTFARVFLASEEALGGRLVTVKVMPGGGNEAAILGKLDHPNIVPVHSVQEDHETGLTAVCMPYLGRATLSDVLDHVFSGGRVPQRASAIADLVVGVGQRDGTTLRRPVSVVRRGSYIDAMLFFAAELAAALAHAHSRGICHRDLKPSNVLLSSECRPLLLDFNLSHDNQAGGARCGGTLPYMAPEELRSVIVDPGAGRGPPDPRSDLYSLGVIAYELLTGSLPFDVDLRDGSLRDAAARLLDLQARGPVPLRDRNRAVNHAVADLVHACLAYAAEARPGSAAELEAGFRAQLALPRRTGRWVRVHRGFTAGIGMLLLGIAALAGVGLANRDPYSVRQYRQGTEHSQRGEYDLAIECYSAAVRSDPTYVDALVARGTANLRRERLVEALGDFGNASRLRPSPRLSALRGYCLSRLNHHEDAIRLYEEAIAGGLQSAPVFNNLAYSCILRSRTQEALKWSLKAIEADASLPQAHECLLRAYQQMLDRNGFVAPSMVEGTERALQVGPLGPHAYSNAASVFGSYAKRNRQYVDKALACVALAIEKGVTSETISINPHLTALHAEPRFKELIARKVSVKPVRPTMLIEPPSSATSELN